MSISLVHIFPLLLLLAATPSLCSESKSHSCEDEGDGSKSYDCSEERHVHHHYVKIPELVIPKNKFTCHPPIGQASFFIPKDKWDFTTVGGRQPTVATCPPCETGYQYAYPSINPPYDFNSITKVKDLAIGNFQCSTPSALCVVDVAGNQWRPTGTGAGLWLRPTPYCNLQNGKCGVYAALFANKRGGKDAGLYRADNVNEKLLASAQWHQGKNKKFAEYPYLEIRGFACNSCNAPVPVCAPHQFEPRKPHGNSHSHSHSHSQSKEHGSAPCAPFHNC